jgi:hypothetical protein
MPQEVKGFDAASEKQGSKPMFNHIMDAYSSAYCAFPQREHGNHDLGEVFDERRDWQTARLTPGAKARGQFIPLFPVLLMAGFTYLVL